MKAAGDRLFEPSAKVTPDTLFREARDQLGQSISRAEFDALWGHFERSCPYWDGDPASIEDFWTDAGKYLKHRNANPLLAVSGHRKSRKGARYAKCLYQRVEVWDFVLSWCKAIQLDDCITRYERPARLPWREICARWNETHFAKPMTTTALKMAWERVCREPELGFPADVYETEPPLPPDPCRLEFEDRLVLEIEIPTGHLVKWLAELEWKGTDDLYVESLARAFHVPLVAAQMRLQELGLIESEPDPNPLAIRALRDWFVEMGYDMWEEYRPAA